MPSDNRNDLAQGSQFPRVGDLPSASEAKARPLNVLVIRPVILGVHRNADSNLRQFMALAERGHHVTYIAACKSQVSRFPKETRTFKLDPLVFARITPFLFLIQFNLRVFWRVLRSFCSWDVIVLTVETVPLLLPILLLCRLGKKSPRVLLRIATNPVETRGFLRNLAMYVEYALSMKLASVFLDRIYFITPMLAEFYVSQCHVRSSKIAIWPNSVDTRLFRPLSHEEIERIRRKLHMQTRPTILYLGALSRGRGIMSILKAFKLLAEARINVNLLILGYGGLREEILTYVLSNDLEHVIQVLGPVDYADVRDYIAACTAGINAPPDHVWWRYQFYLKVIEFLAMKKPLILSDIPAHRAIVENAAFAFYLKGTGPREIADGITEFLSIYKNLDPGPARTIASKYSAETIAEQLEIEFERLLQS